MTGITAWQQQVPLPQPYRGENAWQIPLHPVPAREPKSAKTGFFRGAIALAVNGVPIFNPIKNNGVTDTLKAGELDQWGGHCGRADDYHYHIAPVHLEKIVGKGKPIAVALDGYPIYGYNDPNGKPPTDLDSLNGHKDAAGNYHYHATKTYPYLNGGFYGEVTEVGGQVDPQPRGQAIRPAERPLRGGKITGFETPGKNRYLIRYEVYGKKYTTEYSIAASGAVTFKWTSSDGSSSETYQPRDRSARKPPPPGERPRPKRPGAKGNKPPKPRPGDRSPRPNSNTPKRPRDAKPGDKSGNDPNSPRQPWIVNHAKELDVNEDGVITLKEMLDEANKAFAVFDQNKDGKLSEEELAGKKRGQRSAMAGFIRQHSRELDRDNDGIITKADVTNNAERMFTRFDQNRDDRITEKEIDQRR